MNCIRISAFLVLLLATTLRIFGVERPNVLFIAVDDLRPQLNCYGQTHMHTPHIDRLAAQGVLFERAYCMVPTCGASRASLMTSVRPTRQRFTSYLAWAEKEAPDAVPLNQHFKDNGYTTISLGKVFHHPTDHADGWSEPAWRSKLPSYQKPEVQQRASEEDRQRWPNKRRHRGLPYESADVEDDAYRDADCAREAIQRLKAFSQDPDQPFFLAVGFLKPHLPFVAPKKYWDLYDFDRIDLPSNYFPPEDAPAGAVHNSGELRAYAGIHPSDPVDREMARKLIHGYYACVSFIDAQVGRLLDALKATGLDESTIVVLWGDHGWQLGEHGMWNKHSCFETSMHAPLIISVPPGELERIGQAAEWPNVETGRRVSSLVEFIDIYPTLCDLCDLEKPAHVEGMSLLQQMLDPGSGGKQYAIGRFGTGDTIRSDLYRYSEYRDKQGHVIGTMLYDHLADPHENVNIAQSAKDATSQLSQELNERKGR